MNWPDKRMPWVWTGWLLAIVATFAVFEGYAMATGGTTLSRYMWELTLAWPLFPVVVAALFGGLAVHFWWHWSPPGSQSVGLLDTGEDVVSTAPTPKDLFFTMNPDEWKGLIVKLALMGLSPLAVKLHVDGATTQAVAVDVGDLLVLLWGMYESWNMKKVPETAKVVAGMLLAAVFLSLASIGLPIPASAADMPLKAPPANSFLSGYPYGGSGFYFGIYTEGGGGNVTGTVPGVGPASLATNSAGVGGTLGYAWGTASNPNVFVAVEAMFGWTNYNGSVQGFSLDGPASFEQRIKLGTPLANALSWLPTLSGLPTVAPFPALPNGAVISNTQAYLMVGLHEDDISVAFAGLGSGREWRVAPSIGIGLMGQVTNGVAIDAWVETIFPSDKSVCVGPIADACGSLGQQVKAGLAILY